MITIDGKSFPLWSQFVERKNEWVGGSLEEFGDQFCGGATTEITDITLSKESDCVFLTFRGKEFDESFNVEYGGIDSHQPDPDWLYFSVIMCPGFRIKQPSSKVKTKDGRNAYNK